MPMAEPARIFLVGFPRSGTTLLQSLLAAHEEVVSLPETFFFARAIPSSRRRRWLRRPSPEVGDRFVELERYGINVAPPGIRARLPIANLRPTVQRFVRSLDENAVARGGRAWVEKTPSHLHYVESIERYVPEARFVHIVRSGLPAIASLFAVTHEHPERWGGVRSLDICTERWRSDIRRSQARAGAANHFFVSYERLVESPAGQLSALVGSLGLRADPGSIETMISDYGGSTTAIVADEPWKSAVGDAIENRNEARVATLFSEQQRTEVAQRIEPEERLRAALPFL
jgi:hypothetical protein